MFKKDGQIVHPFFLFIFTQTQPLNYISVDTAYVLRFLLRDFNIS